MNFYQQPQTFTKINLAVFSASNNLQKFILKIFEDIIKYTEDL